jgi:hypothetical protein
VEGTIEGAIKREFCSKVGIVWMLLVEVERFGFLDLSVVPEDVEAGVLRNDAERLVACLTLVRQIDDP